MNLPTQGFTAAIGATGAARGQDVSSRTREADWTAWMRAAISGDTDAYRRFLTSVTPHLRAMARHRCRMAGVFEDAEDIVQEVLLAIHLKRGTWDQSRPVGPWITAIVRNKLIDTLRRRGRHVVVPIDDVIDTLGVEDGGNGESASAGEIDRLLAQLKVRQRDIVTSISINGSSVRETADRLQMTEGAVRVALHRALKALAALYRGNTW
jgi:RNA polymerase sigma factor (sigma-70 family)